MQGDCIEIFGRHKETADLIFADPPFNIGYKYDCYEDKRAYEDNYHWTQQWMKACCHFLKPTGSFWIAIGDEYAAEVRVIGGKGKRGGVTGGLF